MRRLVDAHRRARDDRPRVGFRLRKSIKLGGGFRLNLSRRGVGASWGFKGFRVGVSPGRGSYTRSVFSGSTTGSSSGGAGCAVVVVALLAVGVVVAIVKAVAPLFSTPYPWIVLGAAGLGYGGVRLTRRLRAERATKHFFDAVAALAGTDEVGAGAVEAYSDDQPTEPDGLVVLAAWHAANQRNAEAVAALHQAAQHPERLGAVLGSVSLRVPGLPEAIWFGTDPVVQANLVLVGSHLRGLAGDLDTATRLLEARQHEPHYASALTALVDAYIRGGNMPRAAAVLQHGVSHVADLSIARALRYRLAVMLESLGAPTAAIDHLRAVLAGGAYGDASERLARLEADAEAARARAVEEREQDILKRARIDLRATRTPKMRDRFLAEALSNLVLPHSRERLRLDASRLEVEAVLEKVAELKTKAAKERNLLEALDRLRTDEVPDELQAAEIAALESALYEVEHG
jgi:uncharacterized protein DUF4236/tetratricopeptide repeat protein